MSRGKAINVKIATSKVIKALETRLAKLEKDYATQEENEAKFQKSMEKWKKAFSCPKRWSTSIYGLAASR